MCTRVVRTPKALCANAIVRAGYNGLESRAEAYRYGSEDDGTRHRGIHLFNTRKFFEAHEALEAVWLKAKGDRKTFLHGLIQVAAAFHHHTHGNRAGFRSLLEKGCTKLERLGAETEGVDLAGLITGTSAVAGTPRPILTARSPDATAATNQIDHKTIE